jgi:hypothetical protein|tara:strand:- start:220 stop:459 length:240 start_codon:yes stop_codon:yes gene_type:complete
MARDVEFRMVNDDEMPPLVITMNDDDEVKVLLNQEHLIWLSLNRKTIGGLAEALYAKIDLLLDSFLREQRNNERMDANE